MNILVTGANGFVGQALIENLLEDGHEVTALVRSIKNPRSISTKINWIQGDLLDFESLPKLEKIDKSYYLVHGLGSDEQRFEYDEALAAVNFIKWVRPTNSGIIYLGGLGLSTKNLSPHLRSRHMTGSILGASGLPLTEFRASIIVGRGSLSFEMLKAISERFPFRPDMSLLNGPCQPLSLEDLLKYLNAALYLSNTDHKILEIGGPDVVNYGELLDIYAELSGVKKKKVRLPEVDKKVLIKALDYIIPEHAQMGRKLTESLEHSTIVTNNLAQTIFPEINPMELRVAMDKARSESKTNYSPIWDKKFLKGLLSDKILVQSGLLSPDFLRTLERVGKLKEILTKR